MNERRSPLTIRRVVALVLAFLAYLFGWTCLLGLAAIGDCFGDRICSANKEVAFATLLSAGSAVAIAAPFVEWRQRGWGILLLLAGPFLLFGVLVASVWWRGI